MLVKSCIVCIPVVLSLASSAVAQTFRRTAACPSLGCLFPPDQTDFIAGQVFDLRVESQAPVNGSQALNGGVVNENFRVEIGKKGEKLVPFKTFFKLSEEPEVEAYNFTYYEDLFASAADNATFVNVLSKSYRHIALYEPGKYTVKLTYDGEKATTFANWEVLPLEKKRKAKNVIIFVGDGMTTSMITAARLLGHKSINGKYQTKLALDGAPGYGSQMTHSLDSFITDSANSATALFAGMKSTVNALNAFTDSTGDAFSDAKFETVFEMFRRIYHGQVGAVTTAYSADATPAAVCAHTSQRAQSTAIIEQFLSGVTGNYSWTKWDGIDVLFGGGANNFAAGPGNGNVSQFDRWASKGYDVVRNKTGLAGLGNDTRALGIFASNNMPVWVDRHVTALAEENVEVPGLKEMTIKAIDILNHRAKKNGDTGFFLMSEAASIDKQMHALDYDRSLGELLELDSTVRATLEHLEAIGELDDTLVVVTADHGHGFDVYGSSDSQFMASATTDREKRSAIGTYLNSGLSQYQVEAGERPDNHTVSFSSFGKGFPLNWSPRWTYAAGTVAFPDKRENFTLHPEPRTPAIEEEGADGYTVNPEDGANGFEASGTLPIEEGQGVHSLTDVPVYAWGPGHEFFRGVQNSPDIAHNMARALNLGRTKNVTYY